jgi:UPF0176 protein
MTIVVSTFYMFTPIADPQGLQAAVVRHCTGWDLRGTLLIAGEGINATLSGPASDIAALHAWLRADPRFAALVTKESAAGHHPFGRLKVKVKREVLTFGVPAADPSRTTGASVAPEDWNRLIAEPDVLVIDTRNIYEIAAGTFPGAVDPGTRTFSGFQDFARRLDPSQHRKVAMFCTGGIRCEKASAYLLSLGFRDVYQLRGGILAYLAAIPPEHSLWSGACFVFDERGVVAPANDASASLTARAKA